MKNHLIHVSLVLMIENQMVNLIPIILLAIIFSSKFQMEKYTFNFDIFDWRPF